MADDFHEWQRADARTKQPRYVQLTDTESFAFRYNRMSGGLDEYPSGLIPQNSPSELNPMSLRRSDAMDTRRKRLVFFRRLPLTAENNLSDGSGAIRYDSESGVGSRQGAWRSVVVTHWDGTDGNSGTGQSITEELL